MKRSLLFSTLFFFSLLMLRVSAQDTTASGKVFTPSNTYLALGTGLNYNSGFLGFQFEQKIDPHVSLYGGFGLGSWGYKMSVGGRFYLNKGLGSAFAFSYSRATGVNDVKLQNLNVIEAGREVQREVTFDLKPVNLLNLSWLRYWRMGPKSRINLELGYSILLNSNSGDNFTAKNGMVLTDNSRRLMKLLQPGGLMVGVGFSFGL